MTKVAGVKVPKPNTLTVVLIAMAGLVLVYSAVKGGDNWPPQNVIKKALQRG